MTRRKPVRNLLLSDLGVPVESSSIMGRSSYSRSTVCGPTTTRRSPFFRTRRAAYPVHTSTLTTPSYLVSRVIVRGGVLLVLRWVVPLPTRAWAALSAEEVVEEYATLAIEAAATGIPDNAFDR